MTTWNRPGNAMRDAMLGKQSGQFAGGNYDPPPQDRSRRQHRLFEDFLRDHIRSDEPNYNEIRRRMTVGDAEGALDIIADNNPTDGGLEWVDWAAKHLEVRAPWDREDSEWTARQMYSRPPGWK